MKRIATIIGLAAATLALAGCASLGYGLDDSVRVGITGESGYALLKYPSAWTFQGTEANSETPVSTPEAGTDYVQVSVSPSDTSATAPEVQVIATCTQNSLGLHPGSSDDKIYSTFDGLISMTFGDAAKVTDKSITREGDAVTVVYDYTYDYSDGTVTTEMKYIFNGDYTYIVQGSTTGNAEEMDVATMKAMVNEYGLSELM